MRHTVTTWDCPGYVDASIGLSMTPIHARRETKSRVTQGILLPTAHLGLLDGHQMSLLAAVAATR